jgi:glutamate/tyrosine decarboxylase-like PLP-dependent enzyme
VCFRYVAPQVEGRPGELHERACDDLNARIAIELQERGIAVPSTTRIDGKLALRTNVMNHRTTQADLDATFEAVLAAGEDLLDRSTP